MTPVRLARGERRHAGGGRRASALQRCCSRRTSCSASSSIPTPTSLDAAPAQRPRARLAAVVLPLEQHARRRAVRGGRRGHAHRQGDAGGAGHAHAARTRRPPALVDNFARPVAVHAASSTRSSPTTNVFPNFDAALRAAMKPETALDVQRVPLQGRAGRPAAHRRLHLRQRSAGAALRPAGRPGAADAGA